MAVKTSHFETREEKSLKGTHYPDPSTYPCRLAQKDNRIATVKFFSKRGVLCVNRDWCTSLLRASLAVLLGMRGKAMRVSPSTGKTLHRRLDHPQSHIPFAGRQTGTHRHRQPLPRAWVWGRVALACPGARRGRASLL